MSSISRTYTNFSHFGSDRRSRQSAALPYLKQKQKTKKKKKKKNKKNTALEKHFLSERKVLNIFQPSA